MKLLALTVNGTPIQAPESIPTGGGYQIGNIIRFGIDFAIFAGVLVALGYLVYGGIAWITSGGDKQKVDKARKVLTYSIIGIMIMIFAIIIITLIGNMLGIKYF